MSQFKKYFNLDFEDLKEKEIEIKSLLDTNMLHISGDFYGIQKFIFERLSTKNAAKVLRAKSAFIQLYTTTLARFICHKLGLDTKYIITTNAGKFEIISPIIDTGTIDNIQDMVDQYFLKYFYGLSGVNISYVLCSDEDFLESKKYRELRENISNNVEKKKYKKFQLTLKQSIMKYDTSITNETLCEICHIRKKDDGHCSICTMFIDLGKKLVAYKAGNLSSKNDLLIELEDFDTTIKIDERIKSYVQKNDKDEPITFENLAILSCYELNTGVKAIGILKADVDNMGKYIKESDIADSFENFDMFSKTLDSFFSKHIPRKMKNDFPNSYTVFAGGDDLFLVGSWDVILELARFIHDEFERFIKDKKLSISFGITISKPSTPISYLADHTEHLLEDAKGIDSTKDAISAFKETVKWKSYLETYNILSKTLKSIKEEDINTAFLYKLLDFCEMSKNCKNDPIKNMWKSKLVYSFNRNMDKKYIEILAPLSYSIELTPSETKMFLSEFIYKRRG